MTPTEKLTGVPSAYWVDAGAKEHLRWVMPHDEDALLDALARLHAAGKDELVPGSRFVGMFRAHGRLTPVWDLPLGTGAAALEEPAARFGADLDQALGCGFRVVAACGIGENALLLGPSADGAFRASRKTS